MTLRTKNRLELRCEFLCLAGLPREAPTYHQFRRDFGGPDTEVKPSENQMNNERRTSEISLHDFNGLEDHRLRGLLNVEENENSWSERNCPSPSRKNEMVVMVVTIVTEQEFWS
jgi:hypothetical protein